MVEARLDDRLPTEIETTLYRVVQEALTNVVKHAGAEHVSIVVSSRDGRVAATVAASPSPTSDGSHRSRAASGAWNASRPAVAPALRRKLASPMTERSSASITATAAQRPFAAAARRPRARPRAVTAAMTALRTTLAPSPTSRLYRTTAATVATARPRGPTRPRSVAPTADATRVMLNPEIARRWLVPLRAKA